MGFKNKVFLIGLFGLLISYTCTLVSIALSPWFSWRENALSDLGHPLKSNVAPIFNLGLVIGGFLMYHYSTSMLKRRKKLTYYLLALSAFFLILVGAFNEAYGVVHFAVSLAFFITLFCATLAYIYYRRKSAVAILAFTVGIISWIIFGFKVFGVGVSVSEMLSVLAATMWIIEDMYMQFRSSINSS